MNKNILIGSVLALLCFGTAQAAEIQLSPSTNGGGRLPSGFTKITFTMGDGNWAPSIVLPSTPADGAQVLLSTTAAYSSSVDTTKVDLPLNPLTLVTGDSYQFTWSATAGKWTVSGSKVARYTPNQNGAVLPDTHPKLSFYTTSDGNWVPNITLPKVGAEGDIIVVRSRATYSSRITPTNLVYASTTVLNTNDEYVFVYSGHFKRWLLEAAPQRTLTAAQATATMANPTAPRTLVRFADGNFVMTLTLPAAPGDRDRVTLSSTATWSATIQCANVQGFDKLMLNTGDEYEFMYVAPLAKWVVMRMPSNTYRAGDVKGGVLPALNRPRTVVIAGDGNWVQDLSLPVPSPKGYRVIVESSATWSLTVHGIGNDPAQTVPVTTGETMAFIVDDTGKWKQETVTVTLLMLYSDKAALRLGDAAARARLVEGFRLTNEALENSGANFRFKAVGLNTIKAPLHWKTIGEPLSELRADAAVQQMRNQLKADAIYYEGTEEGCGLAWVRADAYSMLGSGSLGCGTTVMRHELGHNMGLNHGVSTENTNGAYAVGYNPVTTVMGGNAIPYFSTPRRYTAKHGIPMGVEGQVDAVRAMNEYSSTVAGFR